jgi:hypothetical protein
MVATDYERVDYEEISQGCRVDHGEKKDTLVDRDLEYPHRLIFPKRSSSGVTAPMSPVSIRLMRTPRVSWLHLR